MEKIDHMQDHLARLEDQLKGNFLEIEKRFSQLQINLPPDIEERLQEIEDLLLLLQVENMTLKEKISGNIDIGLMPKIPNVEERVASLETNISRLSGFPVSHSTNDSISFEKHIEEIDARLEKISAPPAVFAQELQALERRLELLEHRPAQAPVSNADYVQSAHTSTLLNDIQTILKSN